LGLFQDRRVEPFGKPTVNRASKPRPAGVLPYHTKSSGAHSSSAIARSILATMTQRDAKVLEMLVCQIGEDAGINAIFGKALGMLGHAELFKPIRICCIAVPPHRLAAPREDI
jgi:hypothetical protein